MDLQLTGKTALVSGSTAGIGLAIVAGLAQEGATVYVNGRTEERVQQAVEHVKASKAKAKQSQGAVEGIAADLGTHVPTTPRRRPTPVAVMPAGVMIVVVVIMMVGMMMVVRPGFGA